ncbi:hypothetical protein B9Z55_022810 [Caenorhabditis nigoni]|uniref:Uncharacterized protein n=2 Tax=Caenorhabditis nigoni TaxID=1611254 RepID=A0A2G5SML3_9PELO|nr:hypothetical protein B9Z55_022810 [Caenorhabditis nigoni]
MQEITNYATDENFSNFELEITIPDHATFDVGKLCNILNLMGRSWEIRETIYGKDLGCRCGRRSATYKMANNRIQGWLIISMTEYIPDHPYRCHSGDPHPILIMTAEKDYLSHLRLFEEYFDIEPNPKWTLQCMIKFCFANDIIRARIMHYVNSWYSRVNQEAKEILAFRRVDKTWNFAMLSEFRERWRTNKVSIAYSYSGPEVQNFEMLPEEIQMKYHGIWIDYHWVKLSEFSNFCRFFNRYCIHPINAGAELEVWNITSRYPHLNQFVHREIVETLYGTKKSYLKKIFGMKWLCQGCDTCLDFADECEEHDFVTMKSLERGFSDGKTFKNIEVEVEVQDDLVREFIDHTEDKNRGLKMMAEFIKNNIKADNITFAHDEFYRAILPVEAFTVFIEQWSAKSTTIYLNWDSRERRNETLIGRFSDFVFMPHCPESAFEWSGVSIGNLTNYDANFTTSFLVLPAVRNEFYSMIATFRRFIPSKKLFLNESWINMNLPDERQYDRFGTPSEVVMQRIIGYATDENLSNFELEIPIPERATFNVVQLCEMLNQLGRSWEIRKPMDGELIECGCGCRWKTYRMANNRIYGSLIITMIDYIPEHFLSGCPYAAQRGL